jgi:hypothetical protein
MRHATAALLLLLGCGGATPAVDTPKPEGSSTPTDDTSSVDAGTTAETPEKKPDVCTAFEIDLMNALSQSACEVPNPKPDTKSRELKNVLDVKVTSSSPFVSPGGHVDLTVTFTNKGKDPLPLDFAIDPLPRFVVEVYDAKGHRAELPAGKEPARKDSPPAATVSTARVLLVTNGTAKVTVGWDAKKTRWAPEKVKGTPPEQGYPRVPVGPLGPGTYSLRVVTPLIGVFEGMDKEVSAPKVDVKVQ